MSKVVTAKVACVDKQFFGEDTQVRFAPNYADEAGREINKEWAAATPVLQLTMTVKDPNLFEAGAAYTLTFEKEEKEEPSGDSEAVGRA